MIFYVFQFNFLFSLRDSQYMHEYSETYHIPDWFNNLGILLALSSALSIPVVAVIQIIIAPGRTWREVGAIVPFNMAH